MSAHISSSVINTPASMGVTAINKPTWHIFVTQSPCFSPARCTCFFSKCYKLEFPSFEPDIWTHMSNCEKSQERRPQQKTQDGLFLTGFNENLEKDQLLDYKVITTCHSKFWSFEFRNRWVLYSRLVVWKRNRDAHWKKRKEIVPSKVSFMS
jgi:hypothetical protein